jgi:hypothetical protein
MKPIILSLGPNLAAGSATAIATQQAPSLVNGQYPFNLNGTPTGGAAFAPGIGVLLDQPRQVLITSAGNDSLNWFTVQGTDWSGQPLSEMIHGANAGSVTTNDLFRTVMAVWSLAVPAGAGASIGTAAAPWSSRQARLDEWGKGSPLSVSCVVAGTVNYTVQHSMDDPNDLNNFAGITRQNMVWDTTFSGAVNATGNQTFNMPVPPIWVRLLLNSGAGSVRTTFTQYGVQTP